MNDRHTEIQDIKASMCAISKVRRMYVPLTEVHKEAMRRYTNDRFCGYHKDNPHYERVNNEFKYLCDTLLVTRRRHEDAIARDAARSERLAMRSAHMDEWEADQTREAFFDAVLAYVNFVYDESWNAGFADATLILGIRLTSGGRDGDDIDLSAIIKWCYDHRDDGGEQHPRIVKSVIRELINDGELFYA